MKTSVREITEGAMMLAIVGVALVINQQTGMIFDIYIYWFIAYPLMIFTAKYGIKKGLIPFVGMTIFVFLFGNMLGWILGVVSLVIGLGYGEGVRRKWGSGRLLLYVIGLTLVSYFVTTVLFANALGYNIATDLQVLMDMLESFFGTMAATLPVSLADLVMMIVSLVLVATALMEAFLLHMFAALTLPRFKISMAKFPTVFEMQLPKWMGQFSLISIFSLLFLNFDLIVLSPLVKNVIMFMFMAAFLVNVIYGATVVLFFLAITNRRKWILFGWLGIFVPIINFGYVFIGIIDSLTLLKQELFKNQRRG